MGLTQKYKQQQQQVRVQTNESNYLKGMAFSDVPLAEGYSRVLLNFDIDSMSGILRPRKGLQSLGYIKPNTGVSARLDNVNGFNIIAASKVCAASDSEDPRKINRVLQSILYNTDSRTLLAATCDPEIPENEGDNTFDVVPFSMHTADSFITPEPFVIPNPGIHNQPCIHNQFFKKPVGTFAFGNSYYTFMRRGNYTASKLANLPSQPGDAKQYINEAGNLITDANMLLNSQYVSAPGAEPGQYFLFTSGVSEGMLVYYNNNKQLTVWEKTEAAFLLESFESATAETHLCYTKLGSEIQPDDILMDETLREHLDPNLYYTCMISPQRMNPTEASSWGYNMLQKDPYNFECEETAVNNVSILGVLPYNKDNKIALTPRKNQEITLKCYYRAPSQYHSDMQNARYYATTKIADLESEADLPSNVGQYTYGSWWYCKQEQTYYMVVPTPGSGSTLVPSLKLFGKTKPAASEKLSGLTAGTENEIRVKWQIRSAGAAEWSVQADEKFTLSKYYQIHGDHAPFTVSMNMPDNEVLVKVTISDPADPDPSSGEEYVLSTSTIGLSLVSDELANNLNLDAEIYDLGQCTGMCEWERRLVVWGVPKALNTLFISDVGNPTFFPYPNNIDIFTDPIIAVHNYGNELLVLTTSALYRLTWDSEGLGWTHTLVQRNLHVTEADTYMSCVIKNMFFFKSGEFYYMMVPKSSSSSVRGEVTIAPISKPIEGLLDNFHEEMYNLIKVIVNVPDIADFTKRLVNYYSYVDNLKVVVNYVYSLDDALTASAQSENNTASKCLYIQLIYDTDLRTWSLKAFEAPHMLYASHADALQQNRFIDLTPALDSSKLVLQYFKFNGSNDTAIQYLDSTGNIVNRVSPLILNYQYLDTGNREINTELKKRFREFQFKIKNNTATNLGFYTSFLIDGSLRKDLQHYNPRMLLDPVTNEMMVIVERTLDVTDMTYKTTRVERMLVPERMLQDSGELLPTTLAGSENDDIDHWILNQSAFPGRTLCNIRMPITGKGLSPKAILLSTNEQDFEILGHSWVYRTMNSR